MFSLITSPLVMLYAENDSNSPMISQLLFGEQIEILDKELEWLHVKNIPDNTVGWIHQSAIDKRLMSNTAINTSDFGYIDIAQMICFKTSRVEKITLPGGSRIPPIEQEQFELLGEKYQIAQYRPQTKSKRSPGQHAVEMAQLYMNAPYLAGGKNLFGMDGAGLVQLACAIAGLQLPRFVSEQVEKGIVVDFISEAEPGDLAFFSNEASEVIHAGILINSHQIIHAANCVKTEIIDSQGIISSITGEYTHHLRVIKRVF